MYKSDNKAKCLFLSVIYGYRIRKNISGFFLFDGPDTANILLE